MSRIGLCLLGSFACSLSQISFSAIALEADGFNTVNIAGMEEVQLNELDQQRGKFQSPNGNVFSFGIDRIIKVDNEVASIQQIRIPDIAQAISNTGNNGVNAAATFVVAVSAGNVPQVPVMPNQQTMAGLPLASLPLTSITVVESLPVQLVQNSVNNRLIQTSTLVEVVGPSLSMLRNGLNMERINNAVIQSLRF